MTPTAGTIEGRALRPDGRPVAEARVFFTAAPVEMPDVALLTDDRGRFRLPAPRPGTYQVACHADGFEPAELRVDVGAGGDTVRVDVVLTPAASAPPGAAP